MAVAVITTQFFDDEIEDLKRKLDFGLQDIGHYLLGQSMIRKNKKRNTTN